MNKKLVNIGLIMLFLSGCNTNKRQPNGEPANSNAPLFIRPNTNAQAVNKAEPAPTPSKPAVVNFNAEKYVMVKESDLNKLVIQKTNEALRNKQTEVKLNTNEKGVNNTNSEQTNKQPEIQIQPEQTLLTVETLKVEPVKSTNNPFLSFLMTFLIILSFILAAGYFFFFKKKNVKNSEVEQPLVSNAPAPAPVEATPAPIVAPTTVTPAAQENPINAAVQGASQAATLGVTAAVVASVNSDQNTV